VVASSRTWTAVRWTGFCYLLVAVASVLLAAVPMPSHFLDCDRIAFDPAWAAWLFRDQLWLLLALTLPVACGVTAVVARLPGWPLARCVAVGLGVGFVLVSAVLLLSMATATCRVGIEIVP
jgi:hypothetical protein